jgi:asparagine synthase (glutamine-hydrolysing)
MTKFVIRKSLFVIKLEVLMARFCVMVGSATPEAAMQRVQSDLVYSEAGCALGLVRSEAPALKAGPYRAAGLVAVGEVSLFNRAALLQRLQQQVPLSPSCSDGEMLLHHYAAFGLDGLAQVSGMFVLAVWDGHTLTLLRDPVGARTLFYTQVDGAWAAGSSLHGLRRWLGKKARLNLAAVQAFLTFAYLPGDETLIETVHELRPAEYLRLEVDQAAGVVTAHEPQSYWEPVEQPWSPDVPLEPYADQLRKLLETATAGCLPADQPVGVFLSGGLDSSLIAALARQLHPGPVQTYSINFGRELPNELAYSSLVATHCQTEHQVLTFSGQQIADQLAETVALLDCPVGDPLTVPNLLMARAAAADGLRVILNGEGGDPCFGGPKNTPMLVYELQRTTADPLDRAETYLRSYRKCYVDLPRLLSPAVLEWLKMARPLTQLVQPFLQAESMPHYLNRLYYANTRMKGAHHILPKVERLTASCGLEGRAPLFDPAIVAYSFAIPPRYKLQGVEEKWVLKRAVDDLLPATVVYRPKSGMRVPVQHWLRGPLSDLTHDLLFGSTAQARGLFQQSTIRAWLNGEGLLWNRHGANLWLVLTLELWLRAYLD